MPNGHTSIQSFRATWSNPSFLISDIRALWRSGLSARVPECRKIKKRGLDQYGPKRREKLIFASHKNVGIKGLINLLLEK